MLKFLYHTALGRLFLKFFSCPGVSKLIGAFLDSPLSKPLIKPFVRRNQIDLSEFYCPSFRCFNDCFSRKIREDRRPADLSPDALIAPCDGLLSVYSIQKDKVFPVKQSQYTIGSLLENPALARRYENGLCLVFRLCINHYHRYCYVDGGQKGKNVFLPGRLHTVRPIALETVPVFTQNCREYTVIESNHFGKVIQMEVGAMLVGKIVNYHQAATVQRGQEKGMFLYGGSTVILLLEKDRAVLPQALFQATEQGKEIPVRMGERIGKKAAF